MSAWLVMGSYVLAQSTAAVGKDGHLAADRHSALFFPTRYADLYFREIGFGYQYHRRGAFTYAINAGLLPVAERDFQATSPAIWGGAVGLEVRRRFANAAPRQHWAAAAGYDVSRVYFRGPYGLAPTAQPGVSRVVDARLFARRNEFRLAVAWHGETPAGLTLDLSAGAGYASEKYDVRDGATARPEPPNFRRNNPETDDPFALGEIRRTLRPRLRVGVGYTW